MKTHTLANEIDNEPQELPVARKLEVLSYSLRKLFFSNLVRIDLHLDAAPW